MISRACRSCGAVEVTGRAARYCAACQAMPRCGSCEKVGGGHLAWCWNSRPVAWPESSPDTPPLTPVMLGWAAGFLEGEGSFPGGKECSPSTVSAVQKEAEPLKRLQHMFGGRVFWRPDGGTYGAHVWYVNGPTARGLMMTLYSLMSPRRREQISESITKWRAGAYRGQGHRVTRAAGYAEATA
jgi:hypothetical protein